MTKHQHGWRCRPVEVVNHEQHGLEAPEGRQPTGNRLKELEPLGFGISRDHRSGDQLSDVRSQSGQFSWPRPQQHVQVSGRGTIQEVRQGLGERLVGDADVLVASAEEDHGPLAGG